MLQIRAERIWVPKDHCEGSQSPLEGRCICELWAAEVEPPPEFSVRRCDVTESLERSRCRGHLGSSPYPHPRGWGRAAVRGAGLQRPPVLCVGTTAANGHTDPPRTDGHGPKGVPACGKTDERSQSPARSPPREVRIKRFTFKARERAWKERGETHPARKPRGSAPQSGSLAHHLQTDRHN